MKTIKIRFVKCSNGYFAQRKTWYGKWKNISYTQHYGYAEVTYNYTADTKEVLLSIILDGYYKTCEKYVKIIEFPGLKIY